MHFLTKDLNTPSYPLDSETFYVEDGDALMYTLSLIPGNFRLIAIKVLDLLQKKSNLIFSTDMHFPDSVKLSERARRGSSKKLLLRGVNTRTPPDLKEFLTNGENKLQLFNLMKRVLTDDICAARLLNKTRIIINEGIAHEITSAEGKFVTSEVISELNSNQ